MPLQNTEYLLQQIKNALQVGDKKTANALINEIFANDFTNPHLWHFLHNLLGADVPFETFKLQFAQKYYPSKVKLLTQAQSDTAKPVGIPAQNQPRLTVKCLYCAEEILADAIICRFCGRNLTKDHPQVLNSKKKGLNLHLANLEKKLATEEENLQEWQQVFQKETDAVNSTIVGIVIGLFLMVAVIGFVIAFFAADQYIRHNRKRRQAEENMAIIRRNIGRLKQTIIEAKIELATLM